MIFDDSQISVLGTLVRRKFKLMDKNDYPRTFAGIQPRLLNLETSILTTFLTAYKNLVVIISIVESK